MGVQAPHATRPGLTRCVDSYRTRYLSAAQGDEPSRVPRRRGSGSMQSPSASLRTPLVERRHVDLQRVASALCRRVS
ncbi:putative leader peptide [Kitasatospora gansuensis]